MANKKNSYNRVAQKTTVCAAMNMKCKGTHTLLWAGLFLWHNSFELFLVRYPIQKLL